MCTYYKMDNITTIFDDLGYLSAPDDPQQPDKLRSLLKDLREARQAKSRDGLAVLDHNALSVCDVHF